MMDDKERIFESEHIWADRNNIRIESTERKLSASLDVVMHQEEFSRVGCVCVCVRVLPPNNTI